MGPQCYGRQANFVCNQINNLIAKYGASTQSRTGDLTLTKGALYQLSHTSNLSSRETKKPASKAGYSKLKPGDVLLSHGETPHYHRRYYVSLLSSAWNQVGPQCYGRQANFKIRKANI